MNNSLISKQLQLEEQSTADGKTRFNRQVNDAKVNGQESRTPYGIRLTRVYLAQLAEVIQVHIEEESKRRGTPSVFYTHCHKVKPKLLAYLTLKTILNKFSEPRILFTKTSQELGRVVEHEILMEQFRYHQPSLYRKTLHTLRERSKSSEYLGWALSSIMEEKSQDKNPELAWTPLTRKDHFHIGARLIDLLTISTNIITVDTIRYSKTKTVNYVFPEKKVLDWIAASKENLAILSPIYRPTIVPPRPWCTPQNGGYWSSKIAQPALIKTSPSHLRQIANVDFTEVYSAVNAVQKVKWKINQPVYQVLKTMWDEQINVQGVLPAWEDTPIPQYSSSLSEEEIKKIRVIQRSIHLENRKTTSQRIKFIYTMLEAKRLVKEPEFYFPHQLDFRGRVYPIPGYLNPQGDDVSRALLTFAGEGKVADLRWLKIHAANCFGVDKVSLEDRVKWCDDHRREMIESAQDPLVCLFWTRADKPFQFLAVCFELNNALEDPTYKSTLPVTVDASSSGLQHFSAMLADYSGGWSTNLIGHNKPADIYAEVAGAVRTRLENEAAKGDVMAQEWLAFGFDRKTTKTLVMTLPYGVTNHSAVNYTVEHIKERVAKGERTPWDSFQHWKYAAYLNTRIFAAIETQLPGAVGVLEWMKESVAMLIGEGLETIRWTTPTGFPVQQHYPAHRIYEVRTKIHGGVNKIRNIKSRLGVPQNHKQNKGKHKNGVSANFVHSYDAAHLMKTVNTLTSQGIKELQVVHDSLGVLSGDVDQLNVVLREEFVKIYKDQNVLEGFVNDNLQYLTNPGSNTVNTILASIPVKGNLDLEMVKTSGYFFH